MFKLIALANIKAESDREHFYFCPQDTPPEEAYHVLGLIRANIFEQMKVIEEAQAKEKEEKEAKAKELDEKIESCEKAEPFDGSNYEECGAHCGSKEEEEALRKKQKEEVKDDKKS